MLKISRFMFCFYIIFFSIYEAELQSETSKSLVETIKHLFKTEFDEKVIQELNWVLIVRWENLLAPGNNPLKQVKPGHWKKN